MCLAAVLVACGQSKETQERAAVDLPADVQEEPVDTMLLAEEEEDSQPLPKSVDELFDDFIFNFANNKRLQLERIRFPLTVTEADGSSHTLARGQWKHEFLFMQQDYYTVLFDNAEQMELEKSTDREQVDVEWIQLEEHKVKTYHFSRLSGLWMLVGESMHTFEHYGIADFLIFYQRFATDSVFQREHIAKPLRYMTADPDDDFEYIEGTLDVDQWFAFRPYMPAGTITNIRYGQEYTDPNTMLLLKRGIANGLLDIFTFEKSGRHWSLTSYEN